MAELIPPNDATGTLDAGIDADDTSITLDSGQGTAFGTVTATDYLRLRIEDASDNTIYEIVGVGGGRSGDVFSGLERGLEGTDAASWSAGDKVAAVVTKGSLSTWTLQVVHHVDELDSTYGYKAILVAADGDTMELFYNEVEDEWACKEWDYQLYMSDITEGWASTDYQGNDASMIVQTPGNVTTKTIPASNSDLDRRDNYFNNQLPIGDYEMFRNPFFEVKKWIQCGLKLYGKVYFTIYNTNTTAGTPSIGPGITSLIGVDMVNGDNGELEFYNRMIDD